MELFAILGKYYDKLKEIDFRRVKYILKKEQDISLTSQNDESSYVNSQVEIRSHYSDVLDQLNEDSKN